MPFKPHIRCTAIGSLGTASLEQFSYSLNIGSVDMPLPGLGPNTAFFDDIAEDFRQFHGSIGAGIHAAATLKEVKFASINALGKYNEDPYVVNVVDTQGGGQGGALRPPQVALAVSLMTARRGASGRGRFYIPLPSMNLSVADLTIAADQADLVQASAAALVNNINNAPGIDVLGLQVIVASTKGFNTEVTGVRVGRVMDTIRSRRNAIPEGYRSVSPVQP